MKKLTIIILAALTVSCTKDLINDQVIDILYTPDVIYNDSTTSSAEVFTTLSERFSLVNENTSYYRNQEYFTEYLGKDFTWDVLSVPFDGHTHWHTYHKNSIVLDFDGDGKQDIVAFASSFCNQHSYSFHPGKILFLSDYKVNRIPEVFDTSLKFGGGGMEVNDYNGDGRMDVLFYTTETKMNMWDSQENIGGNTNIPPSAPTLLFYTDTLHQKQVGEPTDSHSGASGDIDNDGDIDFIQISVPSIYNGENASLRPLVNINIGNGEFISKELILDLGSREWAATAVGLFDVNNDGNLDLLIGWRIGVPKWFDIHPQFWQGLSGPVLLFGDGTGSFTIANSITLQDTYFSSINYSSDILGFGFTDYDKDGDIDILLTSTRNEPGGNFESQTYYDTYYLSLYTNTGSSFVDNTSELINANHDSSLQWPNFYSIRTVDIDKDGDTDIVPDWIGNWGEYRYSNSLKWLNISGSFIRN